MKSETQNITKKALKLSPSARAYIAEILLESLDFDEDFPISKEWMNEIQKRRSEIDNGKVELIPGKEAVS